MAVQVAFNLNDFVKKLTHIEADIVLYASRFKDDDMKCIDNNPEDVERLKACIRKAYSEWFGDELKQIKESAESIKRYVDQKDV